MNEHVKVNAVARTSLSLVLPIVIPMSASFPDGGSSALGEVFGWRVVKAEPYAVNQAQPTYSSVKSMVNVVQSNPYNGFDVQISAIYSDLIAIQEPLGVEFAKVWDANIDKLYES